MSKVFAALTSDDRFGLSPFQYDTLYPALLMTVGVLMVASIDIYLPAAPYLTRLFATDEWVMQFSMMISLIVSAFVGLLYGHWSDISGRRKPLISALALFGFGSVLTAFSWSIESFLFFRFVQAIGTGGISVLSISVLSDMFSGSLFARYMATYSMSFPIMFAIAPVIGAHLFQYFGWRSNFWFLAAVAAVLCVYLHLKLPETHSGGKDALNWKDLGKNIAKLCSDKNFVSLAAGQGLPVAVSAIFSANSSFLFIDGFAFAPTEYAYIQLIPVFFNFLGSLAFRQTVISWGLPESLGFGLKVSAVFFGLCVAGIWVTGLRLPAPIIVTICVLNLGLSFCVSSCSTMALDYDQHQRGLAVAVLGLFRSGVVAALVLTVGVFFNGTIVPVYISMGILTAVLIVVAMPYAKARRA